jgi:hypothetical protein
MPDLALFEDAVKQADRHVAEGRDRLARQRSLIARLQRDGHARLAVEAEAMLRSMEELQQEFEQHAVDQRRFLDDLRKRAV